MGAWPVQGVGSRTKPADSGAQWRGRRDPRFPAGGERPGHGAESRPQPESGLPASQTEHFPKDVKQPRRPLGQGEAATLVARRPAARGHSGSITALGPGGSSAGDPPRTCAGNQSWAPRARQPPLLAAGVGGGGSLQSLLFKPRERTPLLTRSVCELVRGWSPKV